MLADPLPVDASYICAADMPAISREPNKSVYRLVVGSVAYTATIQHQYANGRRRSNVRLDAKTIATNPFDSDTSIEDTTSTYLVIDRSERLVTDAAVVAQVKELLGILACTTFANAVTTRIASIVGGES
jgi:hypothetical protein